MGRWDAPAGLPRRAPAEALVEPAPPRVLRVDVEPRDGDARPRHAVPTGLCRVTAMTHETPELPAVAATATEVSRPASDPKDEYGPAALPEADGTSPSDRRPSGAA